MKRREFVGFLGGASAWAFAGRAQQTMPVVGYLHFGKPGMPAHDAFLQGLKEPTILWAKTLRSSIAGPRGNLIDPRPWQLIWSAERFR